jgi:hypothetical protein
MRHPPLHSAMLEVEAGAPFESARSFFNFKFFGVFKQRAIKLASGNTLVLNSNKLKDLEPRL